MSAGTVIGNDCVVSSPYTARYRTEWQLAGQNYAGNYSTINWQTYVDFFGCDAQLDNGRTDASVGNVWYNGGRVYNYAGNFSTHTVGCASGQFNIGHNNDGTQSLGMSGGIDIYQSGRSQGSGSWGLETIPRYANITGFSVTNVTDASFNINLSTDAYCSDLQYSLNNGATWNAGAYNAYSATFSITNLPSEANFQVRCQVRRADSGLWTGTGTISVNTNRQNNFIGII